MVRGRLLTFLYSILYTALYLPIEKAGRLAHARADRSRSGVDFPNAVQGPLEKNTKRSA
jgi:hypothetical protein